MRQQNLNEQIVRIKKLLNITESSVIEEANPILGVIKRLAPSLERKFITGVETKIGKKIAQATDAEIETALKSAEMTLIRKEIAQAVYAAEKNMIDGVFAKYNMSVASEASAAYRELQANGLNKGILRDVASEWKAGKTAGSSAGSQTSSQTSTAGKYTGNAIERLAKFFNGRIDDVTLQKLKDPNSKLRLELENELISTVGKEKAGLVKSSIDKAVIRVSKITESLSEQEAYNKVFETALTKMGTRLTGAEWGKKYFGWFMALPWWGKFITTAVFLDGVVNPIFQTNISLLSLIKYLFNSTKEGALGGEKFEDSLNKIKKDIQSEDPSKAGPYKSEFEDFKKFIIQKYPNRVKENFNLVKNTDTDWEAHYTNPADNKVYIVKYKFKNGNFEEVQ